jgi:hypothetical protein
VGGGLAIVGLIWGLVLLVALPRGLGAWLLGPIWRPTYPLVLPLTISVGGACVSAGATAGLHALGAARRSLRAMIITSAAYLGFGLAGAFAGGAAGSVAGVAIATWVGAAAWWWQLQAALRETDHAPAGARLRRQRAGGRHRILGPALAASADLMVPPDAGPTAALAAPEATARPLPPTAEPLLAGQRPTDGTAARPSAQREPRPPRRPRMPAAARAALATGAMAVLVAATGVGWILTHQRTGAHATASAQGPGNPQAPGSAQAPVSAEPSTPASAPPSALVTVRALKPVSASSFDPYGDGQGENSHLVPLAIDASPATAWHTDWYTTARFGNLKPGTGLLLDMGRKVTITEVRLWLGGAHGADLQLRAGDTTSSLRDLVPAARAANAGGQVGLQLARPVHARYVLIWFTKLPPDNSGTFQASVFNVKLEGWR